MDLLKNACNIFSCFICCLSINSIFQRVSWKTWNFSQGASDSTKSIKFLLIFRFPRYIIVMLSNNDGKEDKKTCQKISSYFTSKWTKGTTRIIERIYFRVIEPAKEIFSIIIIIMIAAIFLWTPQKIIYITATTATITKKKHCKALKLRKDIKSRFTFSPCMHAMPQTGLSIFFSFISFCAKKMLIAPFSFLFSDSTSLYTIFFYSYIHLHKSELWVRERMCRDIALASTTTAMTENKKLFT